jgi:hypothetical protein
MIICTIATASYLHKVKVLAKSVKDWLPDAGMTVCLLEKDCPEWIRKIPCFDEVVLAKDLGIRHFDRFLFKYNVIEGATAVKADFLKFLLKRYGAESYFVYLDPDTEVFHSFDTLTEAMKVNSIVLTPHQLETAGFWPSQHLNGLYNLGFLGVTRSGVAERFLDWWSERLYDHCFYEPPLFVDQKWIDLLPMYFDVCVFKHPGYNVAFWNLHEKVRQLTRLDSGRYCVNGGKDPLCFFHFSCLDSYLPSFMEAAIPDRQSAIYRLVEEYRGRLFGSGQSGLAEIPWSYAYFDSGESIEPQSRQALRRRPELAIAYPRPYAASNKLLLAGRDDSAEGKA